MSLEISEVKTRRELGLFIDLPHELYEGDPAYVPELNRLVRDLLDRKKNPYFRHSQAAFFLVRRDGRPVGRISATVNRRYNEYHDSRVGFFGFFDCREDREAAGLLLETALEYARQRGMQRLLGPFNLTSNDTAGILVEGFDSPPLVQMTYNKPYYPVLLESCGFEREMDLLAYEISDEQVNERALRLSAALKNRLAGRGISFRNLKVKDFPAELERIGAVYRRAWEKNWGFVPPDELEYKYIGQGMRLLFDDRFGFFAEEDGRTVGFAVAVPDINEVLIGIRRGRLLPFGWLKLLAGRKKTSRIRIVLLGVLPEYRKMGIEAVFFAEFMAAAARYGIHRAEASWILENNQAMRRAAEKLHGRPYKRYRIYGRDTGA